MKITTSVGQNKPTSRVGFCLDLVQAPFALYEATAGIGLEIEIKWFDAEMLSYSSHDLAL